MKNKNENWKYALLAQPHIKAQRSRLEELIENRGVRACVCLYLCVWYIYLSVSLLCLSTLHIWVSGVMNDHCSHSHAHIPCTSRWEVCRQKRESSPAVSRERITLEHRSGIALENTDRLLVPATRHFTTLGPHNKSCRQIPGCEWLQAWNAS